MSKSQQLSHNRLRPKQKHRNKRRNELILEDYRTFLRNRSGLDHHHFIPSSRIGRFDCFIVLISRELHSEIHDVKTVNWFIEQRGCENLVFESMYLFEKFVTNKACNPDDAVLLQKLIDDIRSDPINAASIAKNFVNTEWIR